MRCWSCNNEKEMSVFSRLICEDCMDKSFTLNEDKREHV